VSLLKRAICPHGAKPEPIPSQGLAAPEPVPDYAFPMKAILGISAYYHDSAAALVVDGRVVAAAQEERFTRVKHDHRFPKNAVDYCLQEAGISAADIDHVVFYEKPFLKLKKRHTVVESEPIGALAHRSH